MASAPTPIQDAPAPFSCAPDSYNASHPSDFILRSSDGFDFHVHKDILKFASLCFKGMLAFPVDNSGRRDPLRDEKPVLVLPEPKSVLYTLLCLAYPVMSLHHYMLSEEDLDDIVAIHQAAHKYQFLHPCRMFAIARACGFTALARKAALALLRSPADALDVEFP
ncbi:hypothetical protein B0H19DRAFT_1259281 [Mycena capillaripes]|nr:hypothetical protein B0H19DRAFT_1259281 [Mycena capillaripes]